MKIVLALTKDLFFTGKIQAAVQNLPSASDGEQWQVLCVRSQADYEAKLEADSINLVLLDLQATQIDSGKLIAYSRERKVPVVAFGRHTDPQSLRQARQQGAIRAVPNSTLVENFATLLEYATNPAAPHVSIEEDLE